MIFVWKTDCTEREKPVIFFQKENKKYYKRVLDDYGLRILIKWLCYANDATFNFELEGLKIANGGMMHSRLFLPVRLTDMPVVSVL